VSCPDYVFRYADLDADDQEILDAAIANGSVTRSGPIPEGMTVVTDHYSIGSGMQFVERNGSFYELRIWTPDNGLLGALVPWYGGWATVLLLVVGSVLAYVTRSPD